MKFWQKVRPAAFGANNRRSPAKTAVALRYMLLLVPLVLSAQTVTTGDPMHARVRDIGEKLKCQCPCPYKAGSCPMLHCESKEEIDQQIATYLKAGLGEDAIFEKLKVKYGTKVLNAPPAQGFNLVGWIMPFAALLFGLLVIRYFLVRWRKPRPAPATSGAPVDRFHDEIEKELADLE